MWMKTMAVAASLTLATVAGAQAQGACAFQNPHQMRSLTAGFEAWKVVTSVMAECGNFRPELDQEFRTKQVAAFAARPSLYQIGGVATETVVPLLNAGTIRPLDEYVAKFGQSLSPNQLIKVDGKVMAIAMMVNAQHLMYRKDILATLNIAPPKTYDEMLAAAEKIRASGAMRYPIGGTTRAGWNLALDFVNLYLGYGGTFFEQGNRPAINNATGVRTLEMMKKLTEYMDPEYLTVDSTALQQQFQKGRVALANFWASRAAAMDNAAESEVVGKIGFAAAPAVVAGGKPATTIWWDGLVIASNISNEEAEMAFRMIVHGLSPRMVAANNDTAVWLIDGFKPGAAAAGAIGSVQGGAPPYPASTAMGMLHTAIGNAVPDFLTGKATAQEVLARAEAAYTTAAREGGVLR
jgi:multiple sugar transport system substrate-binding protein